MGIARNLGILLGEARRRVDHDNAHVCTVYRHIGTQDGIMLDLLGDLGLSADAGGIDEHEPPLLAVDDRICRITGRAGDVGNNHALLARNAVDERRLAGIRLADDSDLDVGILVILNILLREELDDLVKHIAGAVTVNGRNRERVTESEIVELIHIHRHLAQGVALVDGENDGLAGFLEHIRDGIIIRRHARTHVAHEDDNIRMGDGNLRLLAHEREHLVVLLGLDTAGINDHELVSAPLALGIDAVAGHAGGILHDGDTRTDELVEKCGLADIRSAHNGYDW